MGEAAYSSIAGVSSAPEGNGFLGEYMNLEYGQRWVLASHVEGIPQLKNFELRRFAISELSSDEALVKVHYHTVAPGVRAKLAGGTYTAQVKQGEVIPAVGVGVVVKSNTSDLQKGDFVTGELGWASHAFVKASQLEVLDPRIFGCDDIPLDSAIGALGVPGLTAYFGLLKVGAAKPEETILVSSASGAVGSTVGQIAKISGCRVIGIAGSQEKCTELVTNFGFDAAINYRTEHDLAAAIQAAASQGIDLYFDNVGGKISEAAAVNMNINGRMVICGQTSEYNLPEPRGFKAMTQLIFGRLTLRGFVVYDYSFEFDAARKQLAQWLREGKLLHAPSIIDGIDLAANVFIKQFSQKGPGRPLIRAT